MKCLSGFMTAAAVSVFFCITVNAAGFENETGDSSAFGQIRADAEIPLPTPHAARVNAKSSGEADALFKYMGEIFKAPRARPLLELEFAKSATPVVQGRSGAVAYSFKLDPMLNSYIDAGLVFKTKDGGTVKLSGYTSANCPDGGQSCDDKDRFFLILAAGKEFRFVKATDVVNSIFSRGSKKVSIGGEECSVKIDAKLPINSSKIEVKCGDTLVINPTLKELGDVVGRKAATVRLGRKYTLAYGNELIQGNGGAKFNDKLVIVMSPVGVDGFYFLNRSDISAEGVTYPEMEPDYGFRVVGGTLEIFKLL